MARIRRERGIARSHAEDLDVLVAPQVEVEAAIDRPASLVHVTVRRRSGGSPRGICQRVCQTFWQSQAGTRPGITPAPRRSRWP